MIAIFKYLKGCQMEDRTSFFSLVLEGRTRTNGFKSQESGFQVDIKKNILTVRTVQQQNIVLWNVMDSLSLEAFKQRLDEKNTCGFLVVSVGLT